MHYEYANTRLPQRHVLAVETPRHCIMGCPIG